MVGTATPTLWHDPAQLAARARDAGVTPELRALVAALEGGPGSERRDWTWTSRQGEELIVSLRVSPLLDGTGEVTGWLGIAEDVTTEPPLRAGPALRAGAGAGGRAAPRRARPGQDRVRRAAVSHDLRTPMTSVIGNLELLLDDETGAVTATQRAALERADRNARRLLRMLEELLLLSRVEGGTFELSVGPVDVREVAEQALATLDVDLVRSGVHVELSTPDRPVLVEADGEQIERAVMNLVSNAVKFTPAGGRVDIEVAAEGGAATVRVRDTGVGIEPDDVDRLFERFYRAPGAVREAVPGTGLGLSIVRAIAERHGGTVTVDSSPGEGSTFTLCLPTSPGPEARAAARAG